MAVYQLFVDDSGNREYADNRVYEKAGGKSRYFVYGAVLLEQRQASLLVTRLRELKALVFGTTDVEVKCNWLRLPGERERRYLRRFAVTETQLTRFTDDYYRLINQAPLDLIASVVDKLHMQENYGTGAWYAPTAAYDALMQRAVQAVPTGSSLSVTIDDISGKDAEASRIQRASVEASRPAAAARIRIGPLNFIRMRERSGEVHELSTFGSDTGRRSGRVQRSSSVQRLRDGMGNAGRTWCTAADLPVFPANLR